jgi:hypothetical protein
MAKRTAVSLSPDDAVSGGGFQGGRTTVSSLRFHKGYHNNTNPDIITARLLHTPKSTDEEEASYLSCGKKASANFTIGPKGKTLIPKSGATGLQSSCNFMIFLTSLVEVGFPKAQLAAGRVDVVDGIVFVGKQKPMERPGLDDGGEKRTSLVAVKLISTPSDEGGGEEEEEEEDEEDDEDDADADDEGDNALEVEEEDEPEISDRDVAKHLKTVLKAAGGKIKRSKLTPKGFAVLKAVEGRNEIMARMVEKAFLEKAKGIVFHAKTGLISVK